MMAVVIPGLASIWCHTVRQFITVAHGQARARMILALVATATVEAMGVDMAAKPGPEILAKL